MIPNKKLRWMLSGGEDYELCFTVPELNRGALDVALGHLGRAVYLYRANDGGYRRDRLCA
ncbi:thiamine monophosphate kinase [Salmonella enterica subsp. enterica]|uniref:Thiamine monophosphate kinase n=1 Tax=Salmonella enterica I TaxID=59201 RepID=A0A3S4LYX9_SALET|nr:thiamine monophosphate kinase [Salmonella enterica subsp. enterica]